MRRMRWFGLLVVGSLLLGACAGLQSGVAEVEVAEVAVAGAGEDGTVPLVTEQRLEVGVVSVTHDAEEVCVTYALNGGALADGWLLSEMHLFVGADDDFPLTRANSQMGAPYFANPQPGRFPYGGGALGGVEDWAYCIGFDDLGVEVGDEVYVAANAVIGRELEPGVLEREDVWGEGERFNQRGSWGMWFTYTLTFYELTIEVVGCGSVTGSGLYAAGTAVKIDADFDACYVFESWSAPVGEFGDEGAASTTFTMPAEDVTVTAKFVWDVSERAPSYVCFSNVGLGEASGGTRRVSFDISWPESWRGYLRPTWVAAPDNWDAAWVFVKYRVSSGPWQHATLAGSGHVEPAGVVVDVPDDRVGAFVYRDSPGYGKFTATGVALAWDHEKDDVTADASVEVLPFAIEMVFVPQGSFSVGSGATNEGEFRAGGTTSTSFLVSSQSSIIMGDSSGQLMWTGNDAWSGWPLDSTNPSFPTGFDAFYVMKYSVTQGQYVDFLNTLTQAQAIERKYIWGGSSSDRWYRITGSSVGSYKTELPFVAMYFMSWADGAAFSDWAGLRPMTELEFEKAARGPLTPVPDEYAWGSTSITQATGLENAGTIAERPTPEDANANYDLGLPRELPGPVRVGSFALPGDSRRDAGAGYYGALELTANVRERSVTVANAAGQAFAGTHGDGVLDEHGDADVELWPGSDAVGSGSRGGAWTKSTDSLRRVSNRSSAATTYAIRNSSYGWRGARSAP